MSSRVAISFLSWSLVLLGACSELQPIEANRCGNRIIEKGEACDEGGETTTCTAECRLTCLDAASAPQGYVDNPEDGVDELACPAGQACGVDGLCSAPSGRFRTEATFEFDVPQAEVGDVDADGVDDLIGTGATEIRVRFGDADGAPLASVSHMPAPAATGPFLLADLDGKFGIDLAIPSDGGVVPFYATSSGMLQHRPTPTVMIPREGFVAAVDGTVNAVGAPRKPVVVYAEAMGNALVLREVSSMAEVARCDTGAPAMLRVGPLATAPIGNGDLVAVGVTRPTAPGVCIFVPANPAAPADAGWTGRFVALAAGARFDADLAPLVWANIDADACPELVAPTLIGSGSGTAGVQVLDSTATCTFATAAVQSPTWPLQESKVLGAGNLDRTGPDELVTGKSVLRIDSMTQVTPLGQPVGMDRLRVADFNGDGIADIAGVDTTAPMEPSREAVRILRTTGPAGAWQASTVVVETLRPVAQLAVGDFDGDRINDLAISEVISLDGNRLPTSMAVSVIYGQRSEIPTYQVVLEGDPVVIAAMGLRRGGAHDEDGVDDLAVAKVTALGPKIMASVLYGTAQRSLTAPLVAANNSPVSAIAAGRWDGDALVDLVVYAGTSQYVWPQLASGGFSIGGAGRASPVAPNGPRDFAIATATTAAGAPTIVSFTTSQQEAAIGGIGGCATAWEGTNNLGAFGQRPTVQARDLDGTAGDELLLTSIGGPTTNGSLQLFPAIAGDCRLGRSLIPMAHPLSGCEAASIIEAGTNGNPDPKRREILAICRRPQGSVLTRFDYTANGETSGSVLPVQITGASRRLMVGDFTGDGLEDAITINNVGAVDFATLLVQCATTDDSCDP